LEKGELAPLIKKRVCGKKLKMTWWRKNETINVQKEY